MPAVVTPMSEFAFGRASLSPMSDAGLEGSMSDVRDSSESTIRSSAWVEIADDRGLFAGGGGAVLFFLRPAGDGFVRSRIKYSIGFFGDLPAELNEVLLIPWVRVPGTKARLLRLLLDCDVCANFRGVSIGSLFLLGNVSGSLPAESGLSLSTEASWYPELSLLLRLWLITTLSLLESPVFSSEPWNEALASEIVEHRD